MRMHYIILTACVMIPNSMHSQEHAATQTAHIEQVATETQQPPLAPADASKPKINALSSFSRFIKLFLALIGDQQIKNKLQMIESLFASLLETAHHIIQNAKPAASQPNRSALIEKDDALIAQLAQMIIAQSESLTITRVANAQKDSADEDKKQTQEILGCFAAVVQSFFNILRDPENAETVPANILGMVAGMVNIGTIAMTKGHLALDADYAQLKAYAADLDTELKKDMYRIIFTTQARCGIILH